jgi:hypothetical protein
VACQISLACFKVSAVVDLGGVLFIPVGRRAHAIDRGKKQADRINTRTSPFTGVVPGGFPFEDFQRCAKTRAAFTETQSRATFVVPRQPTARAGAPNGSGVAFAVSPEKGL